jgi:hypothetical protein
VILGRHTNPIHIPLNYDVGMRLQLLETVQRQCREVISIESQDQSLRLQCFPRKHFVETNSLRSTPLLVFIVRDRLDHRGMPSVVRQMFINSVSGSFLMPAQNRVS